MQSIATHKFNLTYKIKNVMLALLPNKHVLQKRQWEKDANKQYI